MKLTSSTIREGDPIPSVHTCDGEDRSPPLAWDSPPPETGAFALIVDDPDAPAGTWVHWLVWDLPPGARSLNAAVPEGPLKGGGVQGANSWGRSRYEGPCPPRGTHRYRFRLLALDRALGLPPGASIEEVEEKLRGHVLEEAVIVAPYHRPGMR